MKWTWTSCCHNRKPGLEKIESATVCDTLQSLEFYPIEFWGLARVKQEHGTYRLFVVTIAFEFANNATQWNC